MNPARGRGGSRDWDRRAFALSAGILVGFVVVSAIDRTATAEWVKGSAAACSRMFGAFWQLLTLVTAAVAVWAAASEHGTRRLGGLEHPELPTSRWVAIILCTLLAGGGVFWSAAEPIYHLQQPPPTFPGVEAATLPAANVALAQSFLHWGFLAWSVVGTLGAVLLLVLQESGPLPFRPSALLVPVVGRSGIEGWFGSAVDGVSIVATAAGTIGPIGFLGLQLAVAFEVLLGIPNQWPSQMAVLLALVALAAASAVSGIDRGIQWLSRFNVALAVGLGTVLLVLGPTGWLVDRFLDGFGLYARDFLRLATFRGDLGWLEDWTVFYWAWFIGYGPLMSLFVARISRGRTVREVVVAVGIAAPLLTHVWFTVLGGTGLYFELERPGSVTNALASDGLPAALLAIVEQVPGSTLWIPGFIALIFVFLATSADSMAFSIAMIVSRRDEPPGGLRAFYALAMGAVAAALVWMGEGSVAALQSFIVVTAVPVSWLMATLVWTLPRTLHATAAASRRESGAPGGRATPGASSLTER
jgi:choline-glycine betaine transporter